VDTTELAQREHDNLIEAMALFTANASKGLIERRDGVALIVTGLPFLLFNEVLVESDDASPAAISKAVATTRRRGDRFAVNLRVGADDRFIPLMGDLGLVRLSPTPWIPGMALHPIPADEPRLPDGHEIRRITDRSGIEDLIAVGVPGFDIPEFAWRDTLNASLLDRDEIAVYVGYTNGMAVSTGMGVRTGATIGVYTISTVPEARGRGYATAMTRLIAAEGARSGCDVATLQASDMGLPIYERLGYRTVVEYMGYADPTTAS
jgi:hypothetical protein